MTTRRNRQSKHQPIQGLTAFTAMVDIVFLLLIYFVFTFQPIDMMARFDVNTPSPDPDRKTPPVVLLTIVVEADGYTLNGRPVDTTQLYALLDKLANATSDQPVMILSDLDARHQGMVSALDACAKAGLTQISVVR